MKLNIGCGRNLEKGLDWENLDMSKDVGADLVFDLETTAEGKQIPAPNDYYEMLVMSHVLEHIKNPLSVMQELWRVAAPSCKLVVRVPYGSSDIAFEDPTHVRQYFLNSFMYFSQTAYARADYGYRGDWQVMERILVWDDRLMTEGLVPKTLEAAKHLVHFSRNAVQEFVVVLEAIKPLRPVTDPCTQGQVKFATSAQLRGIQNEQARAQAPHHTHH
jgi:hypothetical protein